MSRDAFLNVPPREAVEAIALMVGWPGGELPVFVDGRPTPAFRLPAGPGAGSRLAERARLLDELESRQVEVGLPVRNGMVLESSVLWAWSRSRDSTRRASRFKPVPSMVLRFGSSSDRLMLWGLRELVPFPSIEPHNERISYALHAPRTCCAPGKLRIPLPGTFLRVGRRRPAAVLVTRMLEGWPDYTRSQVTARLKDAPSKDAWRERGRQ